MGGYGREIDCRRSMKEIMGAGGGTRRRRCELMKEDEGRNDANLFPFYHQDTLQCRYQQDSCPLHLLCTTLFDPGRRRSLRV